MSDSLRNQIQEDIKAAMRAKDSMRLATLRLLFSQIKQSEIDNRVAAGNVELSDLQILAVIDKMVKQRMESIEQFRQGSRDDLIAIELAEVAILKNYLPLPLTEAEIGEIIQKAIKEVGATSIKDMSKVIAIIKPKAQGRADMGKISAMVKQLIINN